MYTNNSKLHYNYSKKITPSQYWHKTDNKSCLMLSYVSFVMKHQPLSGMIDMVVLRLQM